MSDVARPFIRHAIPYSYVNEANTTSRLLQFTVALIFFGFLFPSELAFKAGIVLTTHRITLFLAFPLALVLFARSVKANGFALCISDIFVVALTVWCPLALFMHGGSAAIANTSSLTGIEFLISYLAGRVIFGTAENLSMACKIVFVFLIFLFLEGLIDWICNENILARLSTQLSGNFRSVKFYGAESEETLAYTTQYRFGLPRARGPIEHSILYGGFFAVVAPILFYTFKTTAARVMSVCVCGMGVLLSLSSAPIIIFMLFIGLTAFDTLFYRVAWRWTLLAVVAGFSASSFLAMSRDPIRSLIQAFTLDPTTGYTRLLIWYWVGKNLKISPVFGIGNEEWFRPADLLDSIDTLWLEHTIKYGYVGLMFLLLTIFGAYFVCTPRKKEEYKSVTYNQIGVAFNISIFQWLILAFTVHIWGTPWSLLGLIIGGRAGLTQALHVPPSDVLISPSKAKEVDSDPRRDG